MSQEEKEREKEIIAKMTKYFVPVDTTDLKSTIPEGERILCSLTCSGKMAAEARPIHVLITANGIAYRFLSIKNRFSYWQSLPKYVIKIKKSEIKINIFKLFFDRKVKKLYSDEVLTLLKGNFAPYCKILSRNFQERLGEIRDLNTNGELLKSKLESIDFDDFLKNIKMFHNAGFHQEISTIIGKILEIIPNEKQIPFLQFFAIININKITEIKRKFHDSKNLSDMLLPRYQEVLDLYDRILKHNPNNEEILEKREFFQNKYNFYTIPYEDTMISYSLYLKADDKYGQEKYDESLYYFQESYKLNPYSSGIKERVVELLRILEEKK